MTEVPWRRRPALSWLSMAGGVVSAAACGGADARPDASTWRPTWVERQALVPDAQTILPPSVPSARRAG